MKALITGASGGLGKDFAYKLAKQGYDLVLVARSKDKLEQIKKELKTDVQIEVMDLSKKENCYKLYDKHKNTIDLLINNAGFGLCGEFNDLDLDEELNMIDLNVVSLHILTKLFLKDFVKKDSGHILNVASGAAFQPGPLMSSYYATKSYVYNLTMAIYEELRHKKSNVKISVLCPGPVETGFDKRANVKFALKQHTSDFVTKYTLNHLNKLVIMPGKLLRFGIFIERFICKKTLLKIFYKIQHQKLDKK